MVFTVRCVQWWCRLDLANGGVDSSAQVVVVEKCLGQSWSSLPTFYMRKFSLGIALQVGYR
jgi:hypothetical protein